MEKGLGLIIIDYLPEFLNNNWYIGYSFEQAKYIMFTPNCQYIKNTIHPQNAVYTIPIIKHIFMILYQLLNFPNLANTYKNHLFFTNACFSLPKVYLRFALPWFPLFLQTGTIEPFPRNIATGPGRAQDKRGIIV